MKCEHHGRQAWLQIFDGSASGLRKPAQTQGEIELTIRPIFKWVSERDDIFKVVKVHPTDTKIAIFLVSCKEILAGFIEDCLELSAEE